VSTSAQVKESTRPAGDVTLISVATILEHEVFELQTMLPEKGLLALLVVPVNPLKVISASVVISSLNEHER